MPKVEPERQSRGFAWDRRGLALLLGALGLLVAVLAYAGPSWPVVVYQLLIDVMFLVPWLLAAAGWGAIALFLPLPVLRERVGVRVSSEYQVSDLKSQMPGPSPLPSPGVREGGGSRVPGAILLFVTAVALGLGFMSLAVLGLGLAGWLSVGTSIALVAGGVVVGVIVVWRRWGGAFEGDLGKPLRQWLATPAGWHWLWLLLLPLLAIAIVGAYVPPGLLWRPDEPHGYDVVEYHFQVPREWHEAGRIVPLKHNVFSYFPFGVEMHYLLAMHLAGGPWKGMYLAQLMHASHVVLTVLAVYGIAYSLTKRRSAAIAAALMAASVPWLTLLAPIGFNEGGLLLYGTLAIGWCLCAMNAERRAALSSIAIAGAMAGFACGVKLTAVPMLLVALPVALLVVSPRAWRGAVLLVVVGSLLFAPWALRNAAWVGNPVFPEAANVLGRGHFSDVQVERWHRAHSPRPDQRSLGGRLGAAWREIVADWRFGYVPLAAGVVALAVGYRDRRARVLGLVLLMLLIFWLGFTHLQGRFFVLAVPVVALLVALADWGKLTPVVTGAAAVWAVAAWAMVHGAFAERLYGTQHWAVALAAQDLNPGPAQSVPQDATLTLVGEAQAFYYQRPMARLRYRTVFDVGAGEDLVDAWRGGGERRPDEWLVISPSELERFANTYWGIPKPPAEWAERGDPIVVPPGGGEVSEDESGDSAVDRHVTSRSGAAGRAGWPALNWPLRLRDF
jgi:hypothetical protein